MLRDLVIKLATENAWGLNRILCELRKLRVRKICRGTVRNILLEANLEPGPERGRGAWSEYIKVHAETFYACDFFSKNVWTFQGWSTNASMTDLSVRSS